MNNILKYSFSIILICASVIFVLVIVSVTMVAFHLGHVRPEDDLTLSVLSPSPYKLAQISPTEQMKVTVSPEPKTNKTMIMMKGVGEPYLDHFGLTDNDFKELVNHNISLIESDFDICASDEDVKYFLDMSYKYGLKVVMPAGSGEAEWGYKCDVKAPKWQKPVWQSKAVKSWVYKWKNHPAIYAWDISNEAGLNFPNANGGKDPEMLLTYNQLRTAYLDVKSVDASRPIMIRMNGWVFYDYDSSFFDYAKGNPYGKDVADIVMINAYSNVDEYFPDFVSTVLGRAYGSITAITPDVDFIVALGAWQGESVFIKPTVKHSQHDISLAKTIMPHLVAIGFFKYGAKGSHWYMPDDKAGSPELFDLIANYDY